VALSGSAEESAVSGLMVSAVSLGASLVAASSYSASVSDGPFDRHDLRQEPYEVIPHVRICAGAPGNLRPYRDKAHSLKPLAIVEMSPQVRPLSRERTTNASRLV